MLFDHLATHRALGRALSERVRQDDKFGPFRDCPDGTDSAYLELRNNAQEECDRACDAGELTWAHIVREEYYEAMCEVDPVRLAKELIQLAACCIAWVEAIERRPNGTFDESIPRDKFGALIPPELFEETLRRMGILDLNGAKFCHGCRRCFGHDETCTSFANQPTSDLPGAALV